jgi:hypothetical protein
MLWTSAPITIISLTTGWEWADSSRSRQTGWEWCMGDGRITLDRSWPWVSDVYLGALQWKWKAPFSYMCIQCKCYFINRLLITLSCFPLFQTAWNFDSWVLKSCGFSVFTLPYSYGFFIPLFCNPLFQTSPEYNCLCINREVSVTVTLHFFF